MPKHARVQMLGQLRLIVDASDVVRFRTYKTGALLAYLAYALGKPVPREELIEMLWPDTPMDQARNSVSQALSSLRHLLEPIGTPSGEVLEAGRHSVRLVDDACATDVEDFRALAKSAESVRIRGDLPKWEATAKEAVSLFGGEFLPGIYEDWTLAPREHLREEALALLALLAQVSEGRGDWRESLAQALQATTIDSTREASHRTAIRAFDALGQPEAALKQYRSLEKALAGLGLKPSDETKALVRESLRRERPAGTSDQPPVVNLAPKADEVLVTEVAKPTISTGLTRFFGREEELDALAQLINDGARLVTLTGPGGMGKTRLSLEVAKRIEKHFVDGVTLVKLETLSQGAEIWDTLASALKLPPGKASSRELVLGVLADSRRLLILDNFEQLCDTGGPEVIAEVLGQSPEVAIFTSSRRLLNVEGEREFPLRPLPAPETDASLEAAATNPAVALFLDRARSTKPDFQLTDGTRATILTLCQRLEGIPLALELAAARIQVLTPKQILERFDERLDLLKSKGKVERHRSLRNAIEWSYSYLPPNLQNAFRTLAVFQGGWEESSADVLLRADCTLDVLAELRDFSLISAEPTGDESIRFSMLDTLREFARQQCSSEERAALDKAHAQAFCDLVETSEPLLEGPLQIATLARLERDAANIRQAVEWAITNKNPELGLRLCSASWRFWHLKSHIGEGRAFCDRVLVFETGPEDLRAKVLNANGRLAYLQGDYVEARTLHERALELGRTVASIRAMSLNALGAVNYEEGHYAEAVDLFQQCLDLRRAEKDGFGAANALSWLGIVLTEQGAIEMAKQVLTESLEIRREIGDLSGIARSYNSLGVVERRSGDLERAEYYYNMALETQREMGDLRAIGGVLSNLGMVAHQRGDLVRSAKLLNEAHRINKELGDKWTVASIEANQALVALESGDLERALSLNHSALSIRWKMSNRWGVAYSLEGSAWALQQTGDGLSAARALAGAARIRAELGAPLSPTDALRVESAIASLRAQVGEMAFAAAWSEGSTADEEALVGQILSALRIRAVV